MRQLISILLLSLLTLAVGLRPNVEILQSNGDTVVYTDGTYLLTVTNNQPRFNSRTLKRLIDVFFTVYPNEVKAYNSNAHKNVTFIVDPTYKGVAATWDDTVHFDPDYFEQNPQDVDVVTHEVMHIVQDYKGFGPVWLTEGIADYGRYEFGVHNEASGWWLPDYNRNQRYDQGYGVTARFLLWLEKTKKTGIVARLNKQLREHTFTDATWTAEFGKTLDELWTAYGQMSLIPGLYHKVEKHDQNGYSLTVVNEHKEFSALVKALLVKTFFTVYPEEARIYNANATKDVFFVIDPRYDGVAETLWSVIRFSPAYFKKHPRDIDVVTHEAMHVVQDYDGYGPWWLAEGIADYARYTLGVNNAGAGWSLPDYAPTQSYKDGYRVTARFLAWMEKHVKNGFVVQLDAALREHTYDGGFWTKVAGGTIDQLWTKYAKNPAI